MREYPAVRDPARPPTHPGAILREDVLPALGIGVSEAARHLGVSRQALHRVLSEEASISPEMAVRVGKLCGNGPGLWIRMQARYDTWHAERTVDTRHIPTLNPAA